MDPLDTIVVMLRGQYLNQEKKVASYPYDDIRSMSNYAPQYRIYDVLGVPSLYFVAYNGDYRQHNSVQVEIPADTKHALFFADYIHPSMLPSGITLQKYTVVPSLPNIVYTADMGDQKTFAYNGLTFAMTSKK